MDPVLTTDATFGLNQGTHCEPTVCCGCWCGGGAGAGAGAGASNNWKRMIVGAIGYLVSMGLTFENAVCW